MKACLGLAFALLLAACGSSATHKTLGDGGVPPDMTPTGPAGTLTIYTTGVGKKIQPSTSPPGSPGSATSISVASARAAWASAQLVVYGKGGAVSGVTIDVPSDLSDGAGHTLAKSNVTFFREYFIDFTGVKADTGNVPVPAMSATNDPLLPDPLVPLINPYTGNNAGQPFNVAANSNQPIWVDIQIPTGTTAGTYTGTIHVTSAQGSTDVPLSVTVWNIDLPDMRTVTTHFAMDFNNFIEYHAGIYDCDNTGKNCYLNENPQCLTIVKRYEELAHEHRIDTGEVFAPDPDNGCAVPTDWTDYDARMTPYMSGTYWADGIPSSRMNPPFSPGQTYGVDACTQSQYVALSTAWATHLKTNGWFDRAVVYAYDEPPPSAFPAIAQGSAWLQEGDPDWKAHVMDTTAPNTGNISVLGPAIGIFTVNLPYYDNWDLQHEYGRADWPGLISSGTQLWFYESDSVTPPYPTFASNTLDGLEPVMAMWGSWYEKATGFLYWDVASWDVKAPWGPKIDYGLTGDGVLLYPGNHAGTNAPLGSPTEVTIDGPIPSYRLKMVRAGLQDWALFKLADSKGLTSMVQTQVAQVYGQFGGCTYSGCPAAAAGFFWHDDEAMMDTIRATVAAAIVAAP